MKLLCISILLALCSSSLCDIVPQIKNYGSKTIHISATMGGISHIAWTLEIGNVLAQRGHNVSFITTDPNVKFGVPYQPEVKTISMGPHVSKVEFRDMFDVEELFSKSVTDAYKQLIEDTYQRDFYAYSHIFESSNTALAICDQLSLPCFDAARKLNIPTIMHMTMSLSEDTKAPFISSFFIEGPPTSRDMSFTQRFYNRFISLPGFLYRFHPVGKSIKKMRAKTGIEPFGPLDRHSGVIKMINGFWGMESPRPVGPFVEYVGPIISSTYSSLPENMKQFMDQHLNVVYIAFGQMYSPSGKEFETLLTSLLEGYENKVLDGFIWSFSLKSRQQSDLPKQVQTRSGSIYIVQDLFSGNNGNPNLRFEAWSPQFAILNHEHCKLFISHGGASSIHESLFNGVPLLLHPFTSDQPANAYSMQEAGVGLTLNRKTHNVTDTIEKLNCILLDKEGKFKLNMESMQALVQLKSRKKYHAADMIEEVLHSVRDKNNIWYRREVSENMAMFRATNWDINLVALGGLIGFIVILCKTFMALLKLPFVPPGKLKSS